MASAELFDDPFDVEEYVERLAWRTPGGGKKDGEKGFDPMKLHDEFIAHINELKVLDGKLQKKVKRLEEDTQREEQSHVAKVTELHKSNQTAFTHLQSLENRINYVATKVVHLGDQLEGVNTPRTHAAEALKLMRYFDEFLSDTFTSPLFTDPGKKSDAADIIHKLHLIAQELPYNRFSAVKSKIVSKYHEIEHCLLEDFTEAHKSADGEQMKKLASVLSQFKGYQHCIEAFINESISTGFVARADIFDESFNLCKKVNPLIIETFSSPEQVLGKLVQKIYHSKLNSYIHSKLEEKQDDTEKFLQTLQILYGKTTDLSHKISQFNIGSDSNFLRKLTKGIFEPFLGSYMDKEEKFLTDKATFILQRFYDSKNHTKKPMQSGFQDLKAVISDKTSIRFGSNNPDVKSGETYLSHELTINLLQETKMAFGRCKTLSPIGLLAMNATRIFDIIMEFLCKQHIEYATDYALLMLPNHDPKTEPNIYFLQVVEQANTIFHLFEKQFNDTLIPLINSSPKFSDCNQRKRKIRDQIEMKLDSGIDKCMTSIIGWMKNILKSEQKRQDFLSNDISALECTNACKKLCGYVEIVTKKFRESLDGNNVECVLKEFGIRFHRLVKEHLQQFSYSTTGSMMVICDVKRYNQCASTLEVESVRNLFENLHSLCNLLVVGPSNLHEVCLRDSYANLKRSEIHNFVKLRTDYRSANLSRIFS